jgi:hypothetical protein
VATTLKNWSMQVKTLALLISNTDGKGRSDFQLKNRGSGYNIKKLEHAIQDFQCYRLQVLLEDDGQYSAL